MDQREADDHIMAKYTKATSQQEVINTSKPISLSKAPSIEIESNGPHMTSYTIYNIPNDQALRVVNTILPKVLELYLTKSRDYGGNVMELMKLGPKACIPDMLRKFGKIKAAIWDDKPMQFEQADEMLMDLVGHILIILDEMENDKSSAKV